MTETQKIKILHLLESRFVNVSKELVLIATIYDKELSLCQTESLQKRTILVIEYGHCSWGVERLDMWEECKPLNLLFPSITQQYLLFKLEDPDITLEQLVIILGVYSRISKIDGRKELISNLQQIISKSLFNTRL